jgi:hypothetical protein
MIEPGQIVRNWKVILEYDLFRGKKRWFCVCQKCGNQKVFNNSNLLYELKMGCDNCDYIYSKFKINKGDIYGEWTVISSVPVKKNNVNYWLCRCSCGKQKEVMARYLYNGSSKSCGCSKSKNKREKKHGN